MSLTARILISFALISGGGLLLVLNPVFDRVERQYLEAAEEPMVDAAEILAAMIGREWEQEGRFPGESLRTTMQAVGERELAVRIYELTKVAVLMDFYVTDEAGIVLFDSGAPENAGADFSGFLDVARTLRGEYGARASLAAGKGSDWTMYVAAPIRRGSELAGVLTVYKPMASMHAFIRETRRWLLGVGLAVVIASLLIGFLFSRWITGPLEKLTRHAEAISSGKRPEPPKLPGRHLRVLGAAVERMRDALEDRAYVESYVRTLSHEMKAPVAAITGAAELLDEEMPPGRRATFLSNIRTESRRLQRLIEQLLALASLEKRRQLETPQPVDLESLVRDAVASARGRSNGCLVELDVRETPVVLAEPFLLDTAVSNLLQNAIDFSPSDGCVQVRLRREGDLALLEVEDDGPGIPDYARRRVFDRFFSLPRPGSGRKSSGLGLCFVKEAVALHGGSVTLEPGRHGRGTRARITLPLAPPGEATP